MVEDSTLLGEVISLISEIIFIKSSCNRGLDAFLDNVTRRKFKIKGKERMIKRENNISNDGLMKIQFFTPSSTT